MIVTALALTATVAAPSGRGQEGRVRFTAHLNSDLDYFTDDPGPADQLWMRQHYRRAIAYRSYFDERLSWLPQTWFYKDAYAIKPDWPVYSEHPEWVLQDADGNQLYIPYGCSGGRCPQFAGDFGNPEFREWWIEEALEGAAKGYRGIWIDDVNMTWRVGDGEGEKVIPIDPRTGSEMTLDDWRRYMAEFMQEIRLSLPDVEVVHNAIWYAADWDDPWLLQQIEAADVINLERGFNDNGLVDGSRRFGIETFMNYIGLVHGLGRSVAYLDDGDDEPTREYGLAGSLLVSNGKDWYTADEEEWHIPDGWWHGFDLNLGAALSDWAVWEGVYRRDFERGMVLLNGPRSPTVRIKLPAPMVDLEGRYVLSAVLEERTARILLRF